ncbi:unnamed protein product, partial [Mesorhabditis spiculigera]
MKPVLFSDDEDEATRDPIDYSYMLPTLSASTSTASPTPVAKKSEFDDMYTEMMRERMKPRDNLFTMMASPSKDGNDPYQIDAIVPPGVSKTPKSRPSVFERASLDEMTPTRMHINSPLVARTPAGLFTRRELRLQDIKNEATSDPTWSPITPGQMRAHIVRKLNGKGSPLDTPSPSRKANINDSTPEKTPPRSRPVRSCTVASRSTPLWRNVTGESSEDENVPIATVLRRLRSMKEKPERSKADGDGGERETNEPSSLVVTPKNRHTKKRPRRSAVNNERENAGPLRKDNRTTRKRRHPSVEQDQSDDDMTLSEVASRMKKSTDGTVERVEEEQVPEDAPLLPVADAQPSNSPQDIKRKRRRLVVVESSDESDDDDVPLVELLNRSRNNKSKKRRIESSESEQSDDDDVPLSEILNRSV